MSHIHQGFWVFGYGSLMWRPGFTFAERRRARLDGFARAFCLSSVRYRGTPERPGLVLGLDEGASCEGVAYRVAREHAEATHAYLREREMVTYAYREAWLPVTLHPEHAGETVEALCYVVRRDHPQYAGGLDLEAQAHRIAGCRGPAGPNADYLFNTVAHLREMAVEEPALTALEARVRAHLAEGCRDEGA